MNIDRNAIPEDVKGWWVSEKFDGVRAIWTGTKLISRHGRDLNAPKWFTKDLPKGIRLDGELWMGRGTFDALVSAIQKKGGDWAGVKYMVFDIAGSGLFEARQKQLHALPLPPHAFHVHHAGLTGQDALDALEKAIVGQGGEGLVIRRPGSKYDPGFGRNMVKVKRLSPDLERWQG